MKTSEIITRGLIAMFVCSMLAYDAVTHDLSD